jgi:predicted DNA-binding transcriptional regulator YafY
LTSIGIYFCNLQVNWFKEVGMRADRLLSLLLLLQTRGRRTARELAAELEVSTRTIYRDVDALCSAGIPIFVQRGPGGGIDLLEDYRTDLTGLSDPELQALFMVSIPTALVELGVGEDLRTGMRKLVASQSSRRQLQATQIQPRVHLDSSPWNSGLSQNLPILRTLHIGLMKDRIVCLRIKLPFETEIDLVVEPYGLVAKLGRWYLVCRREGRLRALSVSQILEATLTDENFDRSESFDLVGFWETWCGARQRSRSGFTTRLRLSQQLLPYLVWGGEAFEVVAQMDLVEDADHTWREAVLRFDNFHQARIHILGFGGACEVLEPEALRLSVADFARQTVKQYEHSQAVESDSPH